MPNAPVVTIAPLELDNKSENSLFGCMKATTKIKGDIINISFEDEWEINKICK